MESNEPDSFVVTAFFVEASLGVGALCVGWLVGVDPLASIPVAKDSINQHMIATLWGVAATVPLLFGLILVNRLGLPAVARIRRFVDSRIVPLFKPMSIFELGSISFAAGFGEEVLFRGLLQTGIAQWWDGPGGIVLSVVVASVLFGACHWITPTYAALAALAGAYFGLLFLITESLLAPLVAHALYDFIALVYMTRRSSPKDS
ncbi:MAG: CPBP family intramembrane metalloprotease [Planctomycetes bacterium]|nr:CPBP family intramembrane metalloprotease [Planctomycetota bacterium]